ncbi:RNB domain-containing ribonuclease [Nocardia cyriacigeorgica]|uniref:RNB domain-containing ribonuclease n=1 Tax=Nocardia cyriacigeorgica TaxID=135487 RepID=UPI001892F0C3|nr:RNB domain-containing ribonuclease [Nocardia cyriacigeorgica]MBF6157703.1 RNB domain-containing ribonuclease [Nocardia cyriacigeorgica]MBF6196675.1 RNB domain-containing ribonuclease [Nocardia cyriacigeorgica]MBF6346501.1 RNB domain-containing ribonuclease [Nocardia cyriacigeorgica]MBF6516830.1 RNB domain-containing ribonuclease [Nocardia cyriacigeorgica]
MELHQRIVSAPVDFGAIRSEFGLTSDYPAEATAEARDAVDAFAGDRSDRTDIPFVTIDPPGAMDLDQALHLERTDTGFLLHYAIADLGAVVIPDGALAAEAGARGQTFYLPDTTVPLHPPVLSENAASLLPDQTRPAALWTIELDHDAEPLRYSVERALVRSRARLDYAGVQADADAGRLHPSIAALPEFGTKRIAAGLERGAIELRLPAQSVIRDEGADGHWRLVLEPRTDADDWNEQVSLLAGMCAARIMLDGADGSGERIGLLRTMPPPPDSAIASIRRTAAALGIDWPAGESVGRMLAGLDPNSPATLVLMSEATGLLRGAAYTVLDGTDPASDSLRHSAIGAPYAHVTAPLRRLVDRFTTEICLAHCAGTPVPQWVREGLSATAETMKRSDGVANKVERACIDLTEATLLSQRIGAEFDAVVVREGNGNRPAEIFIADPPLVGPCEGAPAEGSTVRVRLASADPVTRKVLFTHLQ